MKPAHSIERMCRVLKVGRSGFYEWRGRPRPIKVERTKLRDDIQRVFRESRKTYGHRSVRDALIKEGVHAGRKLILRLMAEMALVPGPWKPSPYSILKKASEPKVCEHLLQRDFSPLGLNRVWTSDITYIWTRSGWSYLAIVLDLYSRKVIGWSVSDKPDTALVIAALSQALVTRSYVRGQLMFHSDQGCQYTSGELCGFLRERGIVQSMSRRGQCWDNAPTESFFKTLKMETGLAKAQLPGPAEVESVLIDWIETWYNRIRRHTFIGYCCPAEYEARWAA
jgi:transposase InsO family protein